MSKDTTFPVKKLVYLTERQAERIADFRFGNRIKSENEAIRQLLEKGLAAAEESEN
jgi:DNA-binding PadR family transcriptional regulator